MAALTVAASLVATASSAATFQYDFEIGLDAGSATGGYSSLLGKSTVVRLTLDNGNDTAASQSWLMDHVLSAQLLSVDGVATGSPALNRIPNTDPAVIASGFGVTNQRFITSDANGVAKFDFVKAARGVLYFGQLPGNYILLGNTGRAGGLCEYSVRMTGVGNGLYCGGSINGRSGTAVADTSPPAVPLPASSLLLLAGLGAFRLIRRKAA
ncbi:VPLPA-CTERM sorting domain-containing protein [Paracoccus sp. TK19116]|uniref:VPLPA-CTERM sorting domain-containing protein n=1 Tax=Paracoccus albicereus TaxID=2922394 RepID=A0ABT1MRN6_9RHOB|nr:VPLPA-CTERM sorting domain-containing protein [Paracoccus albicereus]MCQ0970960.1 VPLPA-CTERM sorting domain-containing protein [Paracoccus albicereus]